MSFLRRLFGGAPEPPGEVPPRGETAPGDGGVGIFAGLFVASPQAVDAWDIETGLTPGEWPAMEFKHLETVKMGTLEAILTGVAYDDIDQDSLHNMVREGGEEGPWISRLRQPLVDALVALEPPRVGDVAAAWADTDEFKVRPSDKPSRADIEDLATLIPEMAALARMSKERGEPLFLMMGL